MVLCKTSYTKRFINSDTSNNVVHSRNMDMIDVVFSETSISDKSVNTCLIYENEYPCIFIMPFSINDESAKYDLLNTEPVVIDVYNKNYLEPLFTIYEGKK